MTRTASIVLTLALLLPSSVVAQSPFIVIDPSDGSPVLVNGGLGGVYTEDGLESPILRTVFIGLDSSHIIIQGNFASVPRASSSSQNTFPNVLPSVIDSAT
jgi:hypothetical protein